ncbi:hypothetical protein OsI_22912 [Oryza sativa Indica Group]|uniref:Glycosyltransferase 61 catalytic domain-containing protein n=1 Tax=Oryza sativa subsp. indica TaxID=39946 RepID=B8B1R8_ORYSI|nr:hypothetical protein OsI_22912 [Oryza sativa Indica Group]
MEVVFAATGGVGIVVCEVAFQVKILRWTEGGGRGRVGKVFLDEKILGAAAAGGGRGPGRGPVTLGEVFLEEKVLGAAVAGGGAGGAGTSPSMRSSSNRAFMEDSRVKARRREAMERIGLAPRLPRHASCSCSWSLSPWPSNDGFFEQLIISGLLDYHVVDLLHDKRKHCFPGAIIGTRFHGILSVNPARLRDNKTIVDFHDLLADVYETAGDTVVVDVPQPAPRRPRLGIVSCRGKRVIENQAAVARLARTVGFDVDILETADGLPLPASYASVSACDVLVGVHSADLTKLLFLRPGAALV